jgi:hypothetical protein
MTVWGRFVFACLIAVAMMTTAPQHGQATEPLTLSDRELDLVSAGATSRERRTVSRQVRLFGYEIAMQGRRLGLTDQPRKIAIALLLPAIQQAHGAR